MFGVISSADCRFSALCTPLHSTCKCKSGSHPVSCNISGCKLLFFFDKLCICVCVCVCSDNRCALLCGKKTPNRARPTVCVHLCGWVCRRMWVFYISDISSCSARLLKKKEKKKESTKQRALFVCLSSLGGMCFTRHTGFSSGFALDTSWRALGRHNASCQCHKRRGKCASSYRKVVWQPPVLIKNALTLNAPINLSMLYLARVALCTVYKTQQLKQVLLASSRPTRA